jgi:hypothetical protein
VCGWLQERRPAPPILYHFSATRQKEELRREKDRSPAFREERHRSKRPCRPWRKR